MSLCWGYLTERIADESHLICAEHGWKGDGLIWPKTDTKFKFYSTRKVYIFHNK